MEGAEDSAIFHLDNNDPPTISQFTNPMQGEEVHGTINLGLVPYDEENDEITLQFQWSTDEENWESLVVKITTILTMFPLNGTP